MPIQKSPTTCKIAGACLNQTPADWRHNVQNIKAAIDAARKQAVNILCLPELCVTGYGCEDLFLSEWLPAKAMDMLLEIIPDTQNMAVVIGLPVKFDGKTYNCAAIVEDQVIKGFYAKHHLANDGVHYEPRWFQSWPMGQVASIQISGVKIPFGSISIKLKNILCGFEICEDAWHPDRPAIEFKKSNVQLILNPSASHFAFEKEVFRENLVIDSSARYNCTYLYTNLLGNEAGRMIYDGDILIAHKGKLIGHNRRLSFQDFNLLALTIDPANDVFEEQIQKDLTGTFEEFSHAVPLALFDYMRKSSSRGFVLSLSGGADSGSIAVLVAHMVRLSVQELGFEKVLNKLNIDALDEKDLMTQMLTTAYQGTVNSSIETQKAAFDLAKSIYTTHYAWKIDTHVQENIQTVEQAIGRKLTWETDDIALQNIQARTRSPLIWALANIKGCLLLTTSNRSEGDVGYTTMDGDTSGSIAPIAGVDKVFILSWLKYAEKTLGYVGLSSINSLSPSAELRPQQMAQTDEKDLMPYEVLEKIEYLSIFQRKSPVEVFEELKNAYDPVELKNWIGKFFKLWAQNQWKRERIAPSFHIDEFNVDPRSWCRFPILSGGFQIELEALRKL